MSSTHFLDLQYAILIEVGLLKCQILQVEESFFPEFDPKLDELDDSLNENLVLVHICYV